MELGELANEQRSWKFWSNKRSPRLITNRGTADVFGAPVIEEYNPLLEEYVDCLHFILSIGLELNLDDIKYVKANPESDLVITFVECNTYASDVLQDYFEDDFILINESYINLFAKFKGLGEVLGFTWDQVEQAYLEKIRLTTRDRRVATNENKLYLP